MCDSASKFWLTEPYNFANYWLEYYRAANPIKRFAKDTFRHESKHGLRFAISSMGCNDADAYQILLPIVF